MDQEILLEQIVSYTIGASEIIPDIKQRVGDEYQLAILPYGPHFYTGILQSAGYLLLSNHKKCLLIIEQANDNDVHQIVGTFGPILGHLQNFSQDLKVWKSNFQPSIQELGTILSHLAYIQTMTDTIEIRCLAIGTQLSPAKQKKLNDYIADLCSDHNIIFLANITLPTDKQGFPFSKVIQNNKGTTTKSFSTISKRMQKTPQIIAYTDKNKK